MAPTTLRERKKRETHRALSTAAQDLVRDRGLEHVTAEEIAAAANVSVRTFFNYFSCKEEAVVGIDPGVLDELEGEVLSRPAGEKPIDTLRAVLLQGTDAQAIQRRWQVRSELVRRYPALLPRHLASTVEVEEALARALAARYGVDPATDPTPRVRVAAALAAIRAALVWWEESDRTTPVAAVLDQALDHVAFDLP